MRIMADRPKDADEVGEVLIALAMAWDEYLHHRAIYTNARKRESSIPPESDARIAAHANTATRWAGYQEALENLKAIHKTWKALFSKMTQERQL